LAHVFNSLSRPGVPLFVMISGALMLDEQYVVTKEKLIGHILKMVWLWGLFRPIPGEDSFRTM